MNLEMKKKKIQKTFLEGRGIYQIYQKTSQIEFEGTFLPQVHQENAKNALDPYHYKHLLKML